MLFRSLTANSDILPAYSDSCDKYESLIFQWLMQASSLLSQELHFYKFATRGTALGIPLTSAAIGRFQGQVANFSGHLPGQSCYRCFVGDAFDADDCDTCAADGVLGAMAGMVGAFAAMQAIRVLLAGTASLGDPQWGQLHLFEGLVPSLRTLRIAKDPECRGCRN